MSYTTVYTEVSDRAIRALLILAEHIYQVRMVNQFMQCYVGDRLEKMFYWDELGTVLTELSFSEDGREQRFTKMQIIA